MKYIAKYKIWLVLSLLTFSSIAYSNGHTYGASKPFSLKMDNHSHRTISITLDYKNHDTNIGHEGYYLDALLWDHIHPTLPDGTLNTYKLAPYESKTITITAVGSSYYKHIKCTGVTAGSQIKILMGIGDSKPYEYKDLIHMSVKGICRATPSFDHDTFTPEVTLESKEADKTEIDHINKVQYNITAYKGQQNASIDIYTQR